MKVRHEAKRAVTIARVVLTFLSVLFLGVAAEYLSNSRELSLDKADRKIQEIGLNQVTYEGFHEEDGRLVFDQDHGVIRLDLGGRYVKKLGYRVDYDGLLTLDAHVAVVNANGRVLESEEMHIEDRNSKLVPVSWLDIRQKVDHVNLIVDQRELEVRGLEYIDFDQFPLTFEGFYLNNLPAFNGRRLLFFWCVLGIGTMLWLGRSGPAGFLGKRVEVGFLAVALSVGCLMVSSIPAGKAGWDEEIHFERAFWLSSYPYSAKVSAAVLQEFSAGIDTWPSHQPDGMEEQRQLDEYLDASCDYQNGQFEWSAATDKPSVQGYIGSMAFLRLGRMLHLPFSMLFRLGRLGNLLTYCALMYFAIKVTPVGKGIMAFIGLMPTPLFLASVYSYDPTVMGFLYLSFAFILREMTAPVGKADWKHYVFLMAAFYIGCRAKAVYAPLILLGLLIPKERYHSRRGMVLARLGFLLVFVVLILSFLLPAVVAPSPTGDMRGGDTSMAGQMSYVLGRPLVYAVVLIRSIWSTLPDYLAGNGVFGLLGHLGNSHMLWLIYIGAALVVLTNNQSTSVKPLSARQKLWMFLLSGASAMLVWTSMYIAFTVPGSVSIAGVQGRYYLPFLCLVYLAFTSRKVILHMELKDYYACVLGLSSVILMATVYGSILAPHCL